MILNPNCSEVVWRLNVKKNTKEEILKVLANEEDEYDSFTTGREYPDGCLNEMLERLDGAMDVDKAELVFDENQGLEGANDYTRECLKIAKKLIKGEITRNEADILSRKSWDNNVVIEED